MTEFDGKEGTLLYVGYTNSFHYIRLDDSAAPRKTDWSCHVHNLRYIGKRAKPLDEPYREDLGVHKFRPGDAVVRTEDSVAGLRVGMSGVVCDPYCDDITGVLFTDFRGGTDKNPEFWYCDNHFIRYIGRRVKPPTKNVVGRWLRNDL
jgi:hypothetical protein